MKLIVTEAHDFVGSRLVRHLAEEGHELLLLDHDPAAIKTLFSDMDLAVADYDCVDKERLAGYDCCLHLTRRDSDGTGEDADYVRDNVELFAALCRKLVKAGVKRQVYLSTIRADEHDSAPYGRSKWLAEQTLKSICSEQGACTPIILRPAYPHAKPYRDRLSWLNALPGFLADGLFGLIAALKPVVDYPALENAIDRVLVEDLDPRRQMIPLSNRQMGNGFYHALHWCIDMSFVLAVVCLLWWLFPLMFVLIRFDSPGPVIFRQARVGKGGRVFTCYKFRTMKEDTKVAATHEVSRSSVTRIGGFLRRSRIDELPQIWNILCREMSLVGPRPCLPKQEELVNWRRDLGVLDSLPGITGFAQIQNIDMSDPQKLAHVDADYVARRTVLLDIRIILATVLGRGMKDYNAA
ncbi:sugar transferase [uncultured Cohaesibacter sp.]|uniref:sugar transferase n=1 Tax=uncultured Cohaesibacter sp. TaxID=1002546 RepID=UPI00292CF458|nr:sugar transferase [uncultured Cohaesibacter sp.]